jgi:peptidoglycan hydrolase-like protein with peptidoglycan-binding domain
MTRSRIGIAVALATLLFAPHAFAQAAPDAKSDTKSDAMKSDTGMKASRGSRKGGMATAGDEKVKAAQQALKDKGHDPGDVDGRMGAKTKAALRDFQKAQGIQPSGRLDAKTMQSLGMDGAKTSSSGHSATSGSASPETKTDEKKAEEPKAEEKK